MPNPLSKPYPLVLDKRQSLWMAVLFGLFVFLFLQVFQPFGLSDVAGSIWVATLTYGVITFLSVFLMHFAAVALFPGFYNEDNWTVGKEFLHTMMVILLVATGNFFYSVYLNFFAFSFKVFVIFIGYTIAIGIFPVSLQILVRQNLLQRKYLRQSEKLTGQVQREQTKSPVGEQPVTLKDEEGRVMLEVLPKNLLAIESADNYVEVYFMDESGQLKTELVRNTLKHFEDQFHDHLNFYRCHRSFLINLQNVAAVKGNARGYRVQLHPRLKGIPVARRRSEGFSDLLGVRSASR